VLDPVVAAIIAQLKQEMKQAISAKDQIIALSEMRIQKLEEELRLERIKKYGKQSEKLSDLQLNLLDLEPAVSSDEIKQRSNVARSRNRPQPTSNGTVARIIPAATNCLRLWNVSTRSSHARPSFALAASAVAIPRSSATTYQNTRQEAGCVLCDAHHA